MLSNLVGVDGMKKKHPTINRYYCKAMGHRCTNSSMKRIEMSDAIQIQHVPSECGILFGKTMEISSNVCVLLCFGKVSFETNATTLDCEHISCRICQQPAQSSPQYLHKKKKKTSSYSGPPLSSIASWLMNRMKNKIHVPNLVHPTQNRPPVYIPSCGSATVFPGVWPTTINLTPSSFRRRKTCDENSPTLNAMSHRGILRINTYTLNLLNLLAFK